MISSMVPIKGACSKTCLGGIGLCYRIDIDIIGKPICDFLLAVWDV